MITVLGIYVDKHSDPPTQTNIQKAKDAFTTENWEFNCYSTDIVLLSEYAHDVHMEYYGSLGDNGLYANWMPRKHVDRIAKAIRKYHLEAMDKNFYKLMGLNVTEQESVTHKDYIKELYGNFGYFVDTIGQISALPGGIEPRSAIVYHKGLDIKFQHDPWRYFKILKVNETVRRREKFKTVGGNHDRQPINSSTIIFCESIEKLEEMCIGHYHCLYTMTRPVILENILKYQCAPIHKTVGQMKLQRLTPLIAEHLGLTVVHFDQFEEFEKRFWEHHGNETNIAEYSLNDDDGK